MNQEMRGDRRWHGHLRHRERNRGRRGFSAAERMAQLMTALSNRSHLAAEDNLSQDERYSLEPMAQVHASPPEPPLVPTALMATDPETDPSILWAIAREEPRLRRWLVANPAASPALLEAVSQLGGPGVRRALELLLEEGKGDQSSLSSSTAKA